MSIVLQKSFFLSKQRWKSKYRLINPATISLVTWKNYIATRSRRVPVVFGLLVYETNQLCLKSCCIWPIWATDLNAWHQGKAPAVFLEVSGMQFVQRVLPVVPLPVLFISEMKSPLIYMYLPQKVHFSQSGCLLARRQDKVRYNQHDLRPKFRW